MHFRTAALAPLVAVASLYPNQELQGAPISTEALWDVVSNSVNFGGDCGIKLRPETGELLAAPGKLVPPNLAAFIATNDCVGLHLDYWVPYYVVEVVPTRWQSLIVPGLVEMVREPIIENVEGLLAPFFKPFGINFNSKGGSFGGLNTYDVHVYRLKFDPGELIYGIIEKIADAVATGIPVQLSGSDIPLRPGFCYASEIDPFQWKLGLSPGMNPADRGRFWEGVRQPEDGVFSWAGLNDRSGTVLHADPRSATEALVLRGASNGTKPRTGLWQAGFCQGDFDPLTPENLRDGNVRIMLVDQAHKPRPRRPINQFAPATQTVQMPVQTQVNVGGLRGGVAGTAGGTVAGPGGGGLGGGGPGGGGFGAAGGGARAPARSAPATGAGPMRSAPERAQGEQAQPTVAEIVKSTTGSLRPGASGPAPYTAGPEEWNSCIPIGWEAKQWNRPEYWRGNVQEGALFIIYQRKSRCLMDGYLVGRVGAEVFIALAKEIVLTGGQGIAQYAVQIAAAIQQVYDLYEEIKQVLDFMKMVYDTIQRMKDLMEMFRGLFTLFQDQMKQQAGPMAINAAVEGLTTYFQMDPAVKMGFYDAQCSLDIGYHVLDGSKALTSLSVCGHGTGDVPGLKTVNAKIAEMEGKIPKMLKPPSGSNETAFQNTCGDVFQPHPPVKNLHTTIKTYHDKLKKIEQVLSSGDMACMVVKTISNPPKDAEGLIRMFGDLKLGDTAPVFAAISALESYRHPDAPLDLALQRIRSLGVPQSEIAWWESQINGAKADLVQVNFTPSRSRDIRDALQRVLSPEMVKDLAKPIEKPAKDLLSSAGGVSSKMFEDLDLLAKGTERLMRQIGKVVKAAKVDSGEEAIQALIEVVYLKVEFETWVSNAQALMKKMPEYQKDIKRMADSFQALLGSLPQTIRHLDQDFANRLQAAVFINPAPLRSAAGRVKAMADRARTLPGGGSDIAPALQAASDGLTRVADAMGNLTSGTFSSLLQPVHGVLVKAADALEKLAGTGLGGAQGGLLAGLNDLSGEMGTLAGTLSQAQSAVGPIFDGSLAGGKEEKSFVWGLVQTLETYARMQAGGVQTAKWTEAHSEVGSQGGAATMGRLVRKTVPLRQEEIDAAGGDDNVARDALEGKAKQEYEKIKGYGLGKPTDPGPTREQLRAEDSPYRKASLKACCATQKKWGKERVKCDVECTGEYDVPFVDTSGASRRACLETQKKWGADRVKCD